MKIEDCKVGMRVRAPNGRDATVKGILLATVCISYDGENKLTLRIPEKLVRIPTPDEILTATLDAFAKAQ